MGDLGGELTLALLRCGPERRRLAALTYPRSHLHLARSQGRLVPEVTLPKEKIPHTVCSSEKSWKWYWWSATLSCVDLPRLWCFSVNAVRARGARYSSFPCNARASHRSRYGDRKLTKRVTVHYRSRCSKKSSVSFSIEAYTSTPLEGKTKLAEERV